MRSGASPPFANQNAPARLCRPAAGSALCPSAHIKHVPKGASASAGSAIAPAKWAKSIANFLGIGSDEGMAGERRRSPHEAGTLLGLSPRLVGKPPRIDGHLVHHRDFGAVYCLLLDEWDPQQHRPKYSTILLQTNFSLIYVPG